MSTSQAFLVARALPVQRSRQAIQAMFAIDGIGFGAWAALLPSFKQQLGLSDGGLSIPLFALVVGSLASMPVAGRFTALRGSRGVVLVSAVAYCAVLPLIGLAAIAPHGLIFFTLAALAFGAAKGALDVSANAQAIAVEKGDDRPIVSACHGCWSLGALGGSALAAIALGLHIPPALTMLLAGGMLLAWTGAASGHLRTGDRPDSAPERRTNVWPRGRLLPLGALAFLALFCEGAMADWGAVYLAGEVGVAESSAALGYAAYALAMTVGRFAGDLLVARLGPPALLRVSGFAVAAGLGLALAMQTYSAALVGFALVGAGLANAVPIIFRSAGHGGQAGAAIASVSTVGYLGFLTGPPVIGLLSRGIGLPQALAVVAMFGLAIALCSRIANDRSREIDG